MGRSSKLRNEKRKARESLARQQPVQVQQPDPVSSETTKPKKKRITFDVDPDLHAKAFIYARRQGTTIKDLLTDFLERETINEKI